MEEESKDGKGARYRSDKGWTEHAERLASQGPAHSRRQRKDGRSARSAWRHEALAQGASGQRRTRTEQPQGMQEGVSPPCCG
jgi:hypothetical protein